VVLHFCCCCFCFCLEKNFFSIPFSFILEKLFGFLSHLSNVHLGQSSQQKKQISVGKKREEDHFENIS
jgi:hypothetical protein